MTNGRDDLVIEIGSPARGRTLREPSAPAWTSGAPDEASPLVYISTDAAANIHSHAATTLRLELGGLLIGDAGYTAAGRPIAIVTAAIAVKGKESSGTHFVFGGNQQKAAYEELDRLYPGRQIVGWYHTHPRMSVFLSGTDLNSHRSLFAIPWQVALVLEPAGNEAGFFGWSDGDIKQLRSYAAFNPTGSVPELPWKTDRLKVAVPGSKIEVPAPSNPATTANQPLLEPGRGFKGQREFAAVIAVALALGFLVGFFLRGSGSAQSTATSGADDPTASTTRILSSQTARSNVSPTPTVTTTATPTTVPTPKVTVPVGPVFDDAGPGGAVIRVPKSALGGHGLDLSPLAGGFSALSKAFVRVDGTEIEIFIPYTSSEPGKVSVFFTKCGKWFAQDADQEKRLSRIDGDQNAVACQ